MNSDAELKASNSEKIRFDHLLTFPDRTAVSTPMQQISSDALMLIANHIQKNIPQEIQKNLQEVNALNRDLEGILWLQIFGEFDADKAQNLWTAVTISKITGTQTVVSDGAISNSVSPLLPEKKIEDLVHLRKFELEKKIVHFGHLEEGWDSYSAAPIDEVAIQRTLDLVDSLFFSLRKKSISDVTFFVAPLATGGIQIELDSPNVSVEIEVEPKETGKLSYYAQWCGKYIDNGYRGGPFVNASSITNLLFLA